MLLSTTIKKESLKIKGIYSLKIKNKLYIGKDFYIDKKKRYKDHMWLLNKGDHYNKHLQNAYNKYGEVEYEVLVETDCISKEDLSLLECFFIANFDSYKSGFNMTLGGEGGKGVTYTDEQRQERSNRTKSEKNPMSKISEKEFFQIADLLIYGFENSFIAENYGLHERYVSLIRHKKRYKHLWNQIPEYVPIRSEMQLRSRGKVDSEMFKEIVYMIREGKTNASIEKEFSLSSGTASRIRNKKLYKQWWKRYFNEE